MLSRLLCAAAVVTMAACDDDEATGENVGNLATGQEFTLAAASDQSVLTLNGEVVTTAPNSFQLDIGGDTVMVEMDDWDWYGEGRALKPGDEVSVTGRVDQDLWERKKIEAESVFVKNLATRFFANDADEEDLAVAVPQVQTPSTTALGMVSGIEGLEYTVGAASGPIRIDASQVNPRPNIKVGDRVYAWGTLDLDPTERAELMARGIVVLSADKTKSATAPANQPTNAASYNAMSRNSGLPANNNS